MARRKHNQRTDLTPYTDCPCDEILGFDPLAVGWLTRGQSFSTGAVPADFTEKLLQFCLPENTVCALPRPRPCPLENHAVPLVTSNGREINLGLAEIRVIGEQEIYAAPALIYHFITVHNYRPPDEFIHAVRHGPQPTSAEFRVLIRTLQAADNY